MITLEAKESERILKRFNYLWSEVSAWLVKWQEIASYLCPERGIFDGLPNSAVALDYQNIIDSTGDDALRTMSAGLASGMTSPSRPWFKLALADKDLMKYKPVKAWLEDTAQRMYATLEKSNYYGSCVQVYEETGAFGTGAMYLGEDYLTDVRARTFTVGEYALGLDSTNRLSDFGRKVYKTVFQLIEEYGEDNVSPETLTSYKNHEDRWILVCSLIEKNVGRIPGKIDSANMPFKCTHWEDGKLSQSALRVSGYHEFPVMCPRWKTRNSSGIYGIGPGHKSLGDIRMLQKQHVQKILASDLVNRPPTQRDANVDGETSFLPGSENFYSGTVPNGGVRAAYQINPDLNSMRLDIQETQNRIKSQFYYDLFLMFQSDDRVRTATEIIKKFQEKAQVLGPALESFSDDFHDPSLARVFGIMSRQGLIAEPPEELADKEFKFEYTSILAQALKTEGVVAIEQFTQFAVGVAQMFPDSADVVNADELVKAHGDKLGVPVAIIRDDNEVGAIRQQKAQEMQYAQAQERINQTIAGAKTLSETPVKGKSALDAVVDGDMAIPGAAPQ